MSSARPTVVVIGSRGQCGLGIVRALEAAAYEVRGLDVADGADIDDYCTEEGLSLLRTILAGDGTEVVYCCDNGNRGEYSDSAQERRADENDRRYARFIQALTRAGKHTTPVWYIGGSWTKRKFGDETTGYLVHDDSPNKQGSGLTVPYEIAKCQAEENARALCLTHSVPTRFVDYISVVPNLSPEFTIGKMVREMLQHGTITCSPKEFGRSLLHTDDAGAALEVLMRDDRSNRADVPVWRRYLIPGEFFSFRDFALACITELENGNTADHRTCIVEQPETPEFLRARAESQVLATLGWRPSRDMVVRGLRQAARIHLDAAAKSDEP